MVSEEEVDLFARMTLSSFNYDFSFNDSSKYKRAAIVEVNNKDGLCMDGRYYGCIFRPTDEKEKMILIAGREFITRRISEEDYDNFLETGVLEQIEGGWIAKLLAKGNIL